MGLPRQPPLEPWPAPCCAARTSSSFPKRAIRPCWRHNGLPSRQGVSHQAHGTVLAPDEFHDHVDIVLVQGCEIRREFSTRQVRLRPGGAAGNPDEPERAACLALEVAGIGPEQVEYAPGNGAQTGNADAQRLQRPAPVTARAPEQALPPADSRGSGARLPSREPACPTRRAGYPAPSARSPGSGRTRGGMLLPSLSSVMGALGVLAHQAETILR